MWPFSEPYPTTKIASIDGHTYDYIIVGAGTGGCALAARLSADLGKTVLLLDRGDTLTSWLSRVPLLTIDHRLPTSPSYKWASEPSTSLAGLTEYMTSGKAFGGSSKINACIYHRSVPADYNRWNKPEWAWDVVEPIFNRSEKSITHGSLPHRGSSGPWKNQRPELYFQNSHEIIAACQALGIPHADAANDPNAPVITCTSLDFIYGEDGLRQSSFDAFLPPTLAKARRNLAIVPHAVCLKIDIADGRAIGIYLEHEDAPGKVYRAFASKEIILCAGAIGTPQLLLLSGVGPAEHLKRVGVSLTLDLPSVGKNLQDHPGVSVVWATTKADTMHCAESSIWLLIREFFHFLLYGTGLFLGPMIQLSIFAHSSSLDSSSRSSQAPSDVVPNIEIMPIPVNCYHPKLKDKFGPKEGGFSLLCVPLQPASSGAVELVSPDPRVRPACTLGTLSDPADMLIMRAAVRLALALAKQLQRQGYPLRPVEVPASESDADIDAFVRRTVASTFHYASSCRMDEVVDARLRVQGVSGLRIADASVFPHIPAAHLQAPVVMVAERCADFIAEDA